MKKYLLLICLLSFFAVSVASEAHAIAHDQSISQHTELNKNTETVTDKEYTYTSYDVTHLSATVDKTFIIELEIPLHLLTYTMKRPPKI